MDSSNTTPRKKMSWTSQEDDHLLRLINTHGVNIQNRHKWALIGRQIPNRTGKQCRERYYNHLRSDLYKGAWTEEEDAIIWKQKEHLGAQWTKIGKFLPNRSDNDIKNRWHLLMRSRTPKIDGKTCRRNRTKEERAMDQVSLSHNSSSRSYDQGDEGEGEEGEGEGEEGEEGEEEREEGDEQEEGEEEGEEESEGEDDEEEEEDSSASDQQIHSTDSMDLINSFLNVPVFEFRPTSMISKSTDTDTSQNSGFSNPNPQHTKRMIRQGDEHITALQNNTHTPFSTLGRDDGNNAIHHQKGGIASDNKSKSEDVRQKGVLPTSTPMLLRNPVSILMGQEFVDHIEKRAMVYSSDQPTPTPTQSYNFGSVVVNSPFLFRAEKRRSVGKVCATL